MTAPDRPPTRGELLQQIAADVARLTAPFDHTEHVLIWDRNGNRKNRTIVTRHDPLVTQLRRAVRPAHSGGGIARRAPARAAASPALVNIDALDRLADIYRGITVWLHRLGRAPANQETTDWARSNLRALVGAAAVAPDRHLHHLAADVAQWHNWCWTLGGWTQTAPWRPHAPCPRCDALPGTVDGKPTGLRVRLDRRSATCISCGAGWDPSTIGILGRHVNDYTARTAKDNGNAHTLQPS